MHVTCRYYVLIVFWHPSLYLESTYDTTNLVILNPESMVLASYTKCTRKVPRFHSVCLMYSWRCVDQFLLLYSKATGKKSRGYSLGWCFCESTFLEIVMFKSCPEGKICGNFLEKRQKCTSSNAGFDQKLR